jgi:hypothetical protein
VATKKKRAMFDGCITEVYRLMGTNIFGRYEEKTLLGR